MSRVCEHCKGRGIARDAHGLFILQVQCPACKGTGKHHDTFDQEGSPVDSHNELDSTGTYVSRVGPNNPAGGDGNYAHLPPHSTPVESYLDDSFLDKTSPRLKQDVPLTGRGPGAPPKLEPFVPVEGAVILEVLTRHKVIGSKGRDFDATVQVVVPGIPEIGRLYDKTVSSIVVPGAQAGEIASLLADTIASMAFENDLMVPESAAQKGQEGIGQGWPPPGGDLFGMFFEGQDPMEAGVRMGMQAAKNGDISAIQALFDAAKPHASEKKNAAAARLMEMIKEAQELSKILDEPDEISADPENTVLKDEAYDMQGRSTPPAEPLPPVPGVDGMGNPAGTGSV